MSVYIQLIGKLYKLSSVETWEELQDKPEITDDGSNAFQITDSNGNVIATIDENGLHTTELELGGSEETKVKVKEHIDNGDIHTTKAEKEAAAKHLLDPIIHVTAKERASWNDRSFASITNNPLAVDESDDTLYVADSNGNIIATFDKDGLHAFDVYAIGEDSENEQSLTKLISDEVKRATAAEKNLKDTKQDNLAFDGEYNAESNKAATVQTVIDKVAEIVANAPEDFDTLKELSDWLTTHGGDAAKMNTAIKTNAENIEKHTINKDNPHEVTAAHLGLEKVDNTADSEKPVSTPQQTALDNLKKEMSEQIVSEGKEWHIVDSAGNIVATINTDGVHSVGFYDDGKDVRPCYEQEETYEKGSTYGNYTGSSGRTLYLATAKTIAPEDFNTATVVTEWTTGASGTQVVFTTLESILGTGLNSTTFTDADSNVVGYFFSTRSGYSNYDIGVLYIIYDYEAVNDKNGYTFPCNGIFLGESLYDVTSGTTPYANYTIIKSITGNFITKLDNKFLDLPNNEDFETLSADFKVLKDKVGKLLKVVNLGNITLTQGTSTQWAKTLDSDGKYTSDNVVSISGKVQMSIGDAERNLYFTYFPDSNNSTTDSVFLSYTYNSGGIMGMCTFTLKITYASPYFYLYIDSPSAYTLSSGALTSITATPKSVSGLTITYTE